MECKKIQIDFIDYILERVSYNRKQHIDYHLQQCEHCKEKFNKFIIALKAINSMKLSQPSGQIRSKIETLIRKHQ
jgi:hypothetical protein